MKRTALALGCAVALLAACSRPAAPPPPAPVQRVEQPAPAPERRVEASPAVKALLAEDPDLDRKLTPEEVRATLAAARNGTPAPSMAPSDAEPAASGTASGQWGKLEDQQRAKIEAYRQRLISTTVFQGPDGAYHAAGCSELYVFIMQPDKTVQRVYAGTQITLLQAMRGNVRRHEGCNPPSTAMDSQ